MCSPARGRWSSLVFGRRSLGLKSSLKFLLPKKYKTGRSLVCGCGCDVVCRCNNEKSIWSEIADVTDPFFGLPTATMGRTDDDGVDEGGVQKEFFHLLLRPWRPLRGVRPGRNPLSEACAQNSTASLQVDPAHHRQEYST